MSHEVFQTEKKVNLADFAGGGLDLQCVLRFSEGTGRTKEALHYEDSPDAGVSMYEVLIPMDAPIMLRISPVTADKGTPELGGFEVVTVELGQGVIIHPRTCHLVTQAGRFLVLKTRGGHKYSRMAATPEGECRHQAECRSSHVCPNPVAV